MSSRLGPRTTRDPRARRVPTERSLCPESTEPTSGRSAGEGGGQVDVHVRDDLGRAGRPGCAKRVAAALAGQDHGLHAIERGGQTLGHQGGTVGAAVVDDGHQGAEREGLVEVAAQRGDAGLQGGASL